MVIMSSPFCIVYRTMCRRKLKQTRNRFSLLCVYILGSRKMYLVFLADFLPFLTVKQGITFD
jgi:hypothetical protein